MHNWPPERHLALPTRTFSSGRAFSKPMTPNKLWGHHSISQAAQLPQKTYPGSHLYKNYHRESGFQLTPQMEKNTSWKWHKEKHLGNHYTTIRSKPTWQRLWERPHSHWVDLCPNTWLTTATTKKHNVPKVSSFKLRWNQFLKIKVFFKQLILNFVLKAKTILIIILIWNLNHIH